MLPRYTKKNRIFPKDNAYAWSNKCTTLFIKICEFVCFCLCLRVYVWVNANRYVWMYICIYVFMPMREVKSECMYLFNVCTPLVSRSTCSLSFPQEKVIWGFNLKFNFSNRTVKCYLCWDSVFRTYLYIELHLTSSLSLCGTTLYVVFLFYCAFIMLI